MNTRAKVVVGVSAVVVMAVFVVGAIVLSGYVSQRTRTDRRLTAIAEQNQINGEQAKQALQILADVTGPSGQAKSIDILKRNAIETDCRIRRMQARLPAPDPSESCQSQTDPSIFPGIAGQPSR